MYKEWKIIKQKLETQKKYIKIYSVDPGFRLAAKTYFAEYLFFFDSILYLCVRHYI